MHLDQRYLHSISVKLHLDPLKESNIELALFKIPNEVVTSVDAKIDNLVRGGLGSENKKALELPSVFRFWCD